MLLIVACHFIIHFNWNTHHYDLMLIQEPGWTNALKFLIVQYGQVGVSIFFIISGYFLVDKTFKRRRIFKTWFQMFCYSSGFFITLLIIGVFYKYPTVIQPLMQGSELFRTIAASFSHSSMGATGSSAHTYSCFYVRRSSIPYVNHFPSALI